METLQHWIGGQSSEPCAGEYFDDRNPLDDSVFARAAFGSRADVERAVEAAHGAFQLYCQTSPSEREAWLIGAAEELQRQANELVDLLIDEVGSPVTKARREVAAATRILRAAAGATRQLTGKTYPTDIPGRVSMSVRRPLGVIAGMTPFNVPLIKGVKHIAMPLATGNTVVWLPSEEAPAIAVRLAKLFSRAGLPDGAMNVVTGQGSQIGDAFTKHPKVRAVGFTGSTRVGKHIGKLCGEYGKRVTLEMGGKNALVVLKDADLDQAVAGSVIGSFFYQGQICMASSRIYVEQSIYESFIEKFVHAANQLAMGDLRDAKTMIGPIINTKQRNRVESHIRDAISSGATLATGGHFEGHCCQPTILTRVGPDAKLNNEETFGPVTSVHFVSSPDEALERVNDSSYGLSASIYTRDLEAAMKFAENATVGMVHVNGTTIQEEPHVPFGGVGDSGVGRESTDVEISDWTEWKWITMQYSHELS